MAGNEKNKELYYAFSLTEVLIALLVVSVTLSALAPVLTKKATSDKRPSSNSAYKVWNDIQWMKFHWNNHGGQPTGLWGGNSNTDMYTYNPSNFSVNYANSAGNANNASTLGGYTVEQIIAMAKSDAEASQGSGDFEGSLATNGWTKLPNGLIIQWRIVGDGANNTTDTVLSNNTFPIAFPHACFGIIATIENPTNVTDAWSCYAIATSLSTFTVVLDRASNATAIKRKIFVVAIGY